MPISKLLIYKAQKQKSVAKVYDIVQLLYGGEQEKCRRPLSIPAVPLPWKVSQSMSPSLSYSFIESSFAYM